MQSKQWPVRLGVRTQGFHPCNRGSIPLRATKTRTKFKEMANHKSSVKRIRQTEARRIHNRYFAKTTRNALKAIRTTTDKAVATEMLPKVTALLDKLAKKSIIHKNKAANLKSSIQKHVNVLA